MINTENITKEVTCKQAIHGIETQDGKHQQMREREDKLSPLFSLVKAEVFVDDDLEVMSQNEGHSLSLYTKPDLMQ